MDCGNKTAIAGGLDPRLLGEVGDLAFTTALPEKHLGKMPPHSAIANRL
jgi:hypothetical protein